MTNLLSQLTSFFESYLREHPDPQSRRGAQHFPLWIKRHRRAFFLKNRDELALKGLQREFHEIQRILKAIKFDSGEELYLKGFEMPLPRIIYYGIDGGRGRIR